LDSIFTLVSSEDRSSIKFEEVENEWLKISKSFSGRFSEQNDNINKRAKVAKVTSKAQC